MNLFTYTGKVNKIIDADTIDVTLDLGFEVYKKLRCRLAHINAPEMKTDAGKAAKIFLSAALPINDTVIVISKEYDKYGRSVAEIFHNDVNINQMLLDTGHAVPYM
jgi:micrococcal nuclease